MKRLSLPVLAILITVMLSGLLQAQRGADEATAIANGFIERIMKAWQARDGRAYAAEFWPDAEIVNVFGGVMAGEEVIGPRMDQILKGALNERDSKQSIRKVRQLAPGVIVVDTVNTDAGNAAGVQTMFKYILEKRGNDWRAVAGQNTRVSKPTF
jgi:uncharacterized protein (TIGR02246 family)